LPESAKTTQAPVVQREDPLTEALLRAKSWMTELANDSSFCRADIARREGLTRARVTQLLALNRIPSDAPQQVRLEMSAGRRPVSIRALLRLID